MRIPRLVVAATHSGAGKTTLALGLMALLTGRGRQVQGFKIGPDYIDAAYHARVTGRPARNLDSWLVGSENLVRLLARGCQGADMAVIEGVMGLYDGRRDNGAGSTAEVAKILRVPVILVVDARGLGQSIGALVRGYQVFDPQVPLAGVICNRVGKSPGHAALLKASVEKATGLPVLGWLPRQEEIAFDARYLGLQASQEVADLEKTIGPLVDSLKANLDLERLEQIAAAAPPLAAPEVRWPAIAPEGPRVRVAVARDAAFHFYYQETLELLEEYGGEPAYFSPLEDSRLPARTCGLIIGGGFPEVFLPRLAANRSLLQQIRGLAAAGMPVYAECGGLMYLSQEVDGSTLAGVVPARVEMRRSRQALGYRVARAARDNLLVRAGEEVRGHEFHYSRLIPLSGGFPWAWEMEDGTREGYACGNLLASYLHLHWATNPEWARSFLRRAAAFRPG